MRTKGRRVPIHPTAFRKSMYETISSSPPDLRCLTTTSGVPPRRLLNLTETPFRLLMHTRQNFDPSRAAPVAARRMGRSCVRSATLDPAQIDPAWTGPICSEVRSLGGDRVQDVDPSGSASPRERRP